MASGGAEDERSGQDRIADALAPFGWTCGPDFWERYYTDPWVFNLANAVEALSRPAESGDAAVPDGSHSGPDTTS